MEIGFFGFIVLVVIYMLFREPVKATTKAANEGMSKIILELKDPNEITKLKKKFGCNDPEVRTMSQLLEWVDKQ
jgi:hypothetical protein